MEHVPALPNAQANENGAFHSGGPLAAPARGLLRSLMAILTEDSSDTAETRLLPILRCFVTEVLRECRSWDDPPSGLLEWQRAVAWISDHPGNELTRQHIADAVNVHPNHLSRLCKRFTTHSLATYLTDIRMSRAQELLRNTDLPIPAIAELSGYHDETHFRKRFKHHTGHTPGAWRKNHSDTPNNFRSKGLAS